VFGMGVTTDLESGTSMEVGAGGAGTRHDFFGASLPVTENLALC
jgi:hypothetical protein